MALGATLTPRPPPARTPDTRGSFKPSLLPLEDIQVIPPHCPLPSPESAIFSQSSCLLLNQLRFAAGIIAKMSPMMRARTHPSVWDRLLFLHRHPLTTPPHFFAVPFGAWEQVTAANSVATKSKVNVVRGKCPGCKFEIFMLISHCTDKARGPAASSPAAHLKSRSCGHSARRLKLFNHCVARKKRRTRQEEVWGDGEPWGAAARAGTLRHGRGAPEPPRACRRVGERRARVYTRRAGGLRGLHL